MKITPLEIRQKVFEKAFRGLDKEEVYAYLQSLSQEWEKMMDENKELRIKLEASQMEVQKLREVESSLYKTLKTAEDTGASMIDQATKAAELHLKESQIKAEAILNDAKTKAKNTIEESEVRARNAIDSMEDQIRNLVQIYRNLENVRDDLLSDIKTFANEALEKVERVKSQIRRSDIEEELQAVRAQTPAPQPPPVASPPEKEAPLSTDNGKYPEQEEKGEKQQQSSFFDEIE